ncbi:unnamed protein product [Phaedon cochleariae]|uniref:CRAL-TRIO domain-containing protein n=1 Tax=Phaedon cochleariae TaxID=80249 RepID=A0A9P0DNK4_PHACE|nr:unnamed protein product [Phaedon cochleariae]
MTTKLMMAPAWSAGCNSKPPLGRVGKELYEIADQELRENETARRECLAHLRDWIGRNPDLQNCITDDNFLLRFLRVKKFSLAMAEQTLLKYLNFRKKFKHIMFDLDYTDTKISELIDSGYIFVSPFRDCNGRRVVIYDSSKFDIQKFDGTDMSRAHAITYETLMDDEENQILGVSHVGDVSAVGPSFIGLFSITEFAYLIRWGEQSFPMRHKDIHVVNIPTALKYVYDFARSLMSQKLKERLVVHDSLKQLHQKVSARCLPSEFGGDMPAAEMIRLWKAELEAKRPRLLTFDQMSLLSDRGIVRRSKPPAEDVTGSGSLPGSFRRLELD